MFAIDAQDAARNETPRPTSDVERWTGRMLASLALLALAIAAMCALGIAASLHLYLAPPADTVLDLAWPHALFDLLWLLPAGTFVWAVVLLTRSPPFGGPRSPASARSTALIGAVAWFAFSVASGIYHWAVPSQPVSMDAVLTGKLLVAAAELAKFVAWMGVLWVLLVATWWQPATTDRRWLVAAMLLTVAAAVADALYFVLYVRRHFLLRAIIDGREGALEWPAREPVVQAGLLAGLVGLAALVVTLVALVRCRKRARLGITVRRGAIAS